MGLLGHLAGQSGTVVWCNRSRRNRLTCVFALKGVERTAAVEAWSEIHSKMQRGRGKLVCAAAQASINKPGEKHVHFGFLVPFYSAQFFIDPVGPSEVQSWVCVIFFHFDLGRSKKLLLLLGGRHPSSSQRRHVFNVVVFRCWGLLREGAVFHDCS